MASNGDILVVTVVSTASIYSISGATTDEPAVSLIHTFDNMNYATGITATQPGIFAFIGGNQSEVGIGADGTFGIWEADLRLREPVVKELVHILESGYLRGTEALPGKPTTLLVPDGALCLVWKVVRPLAGTRS